MKDVDLVAIKEKLPYGSIQIIADQLKIPARTVTNVFEKGWNPKYHNAVIACALQIIKNGIQGKAALITEAAELNLTTDSLMSIPFKKKKIKGFVGSKKRGFFAGVGIWIVLIALGLIIWLLTRNKK